jgi:general secretion pathway protein L
MTTYRIRVGRETPASGTLEWALLDARGSLVRGGTANLRQPPFKGSCEIVVESELVLLDRLTVPAAQQRRLGTGLRFAAEESALPDPERLHVAAQSEPGKHFLHVAIVDRQWLSQLITQLQRAGIAPQAACPECLLPRLAPGAWTVVWNGAASFARLGDLEGFALDAASGSDVPVSLVLALQKAREASAPPEKIIVRVPAGSGAALPDLASWSSTLRIPVERGPAWHWFEPEQAARLDLLQEEFAPRIGGLAARLQRSAMLAGALVALVSCGIAIDWAAQARERKELAGVMERLYRETFGDNAVLVDAPLQMSRALAELRIRAGRPGPGDFLPLLQSISERLLPAGQRIETITYENAAVTVSFQPPDSAAIPALLQQMRAKARLQGLEVRFDSLETGGKHVVRIFARPSAR